MNMRRNTNKEIGGAAVGVNQVPPQAPTAGMEMHLNQAMLKHGEVTIAFVQKAQAMTLQA